MKFHRSTLCKLSRFALTSHSLTCQCSRTYSGDGEEEAVREGFNPDEPEAHNPEQIHNLNYPFTSQESKDEQMKKDINPPVSEEAQHWETRDVSNAPDGHDDDGPSAQYGSFREERNVWNEG